MLAPRLCSQIADILRDHFSRSTSNLDRVILAEFKKVLESARICCDRVRSKAERYAAFDPTLSIPMSRADREAIRHGFNGEQRSRHWISSLGRLLQAHNRSRNPIPNNL